MKSHFDGVELGHLSIALTVAAVEHACITALLVALTALGAITGETAVVWGTTILVPLSLVVGYLGAGVAARSARRTAEVAPAGAPEAGRMVALS